MFMALGPDDIGLDMKKDLGKRWKIVQVDRYLHIIIVFTADRSASALGNFFAV